MPAAYMLSDVVVSASTEPEAFGRVMVEAQAMGRPVVASDHGASRETIIHGKTGWTFRPGDPEELADALRHSLALTSGERERLAYNAISHVRHRFTVENMRNRTMTAYRAVLAQTTLVD